MGSKQENAIDVRNGYGLRFSRTDAGGAGEYPLGEV